MSESAFEIYEQASQEQNNRNQARRIRTRVTEARRNPHPAAVRWPFELLQNALDVGPRIEKSSVRISLHHDATKLIFEHDGAPFTSLELAALLSGGSSKEFESEVTTGRFGTGFLVTHVLAERTALKGILAIPNEWEWFELILDRGGDEDTILKNIHSCNDAIRAARPLKESSEFPSARFEYDLTDDTWLVLGLRTLKDALPYLYATRHNLGSVEMRSETDGVETWRASEVCKESLEHGYLEYRDVTVEQQGMPITELRVYRFVSTEDAAAAALLLLEKKEDHWNVLIPGEESPRIYREYPVRGSGFVPISFIFDGKFEPDQERSKLLMSDEDKQALEAAFSAAVTAAKYARDQQWVNAHLLARSSMPTTAFDPANPDEVKWWVDNLATFANRLAKLHIVRCTAQILPAIASEGGAYADFIVPRLFSSSPEEETTVERLWPLVEEATDLYPPSQELASDWSKIAEGWHGLGVELGRVSVNELASYVRKDAKRLDGLRVTGDKKKWLTAFFDIVGECWNARSGVEISVLMDILPNQNEDLCSPAELRRDAGVSERLKDICTSAGYDVRRYLLLDGFDEIAAESGLSHVSEMLSKAIYISESEDGVIEGFVKHLEDRFPEDEECDEENIALENASVHLLGYLWDSKRNDAAPIVRRLPFISSNRHSVRWSHDRMMMAPVSVWHEAARTFAKAYPPHRVLADLYAGSETERVPSSVAALVAWGIAIGDPITIDTPVELKERRLAMISSVNTDGVVISGETFSQIALLQPEVLNRCQEGIEEARALLGLVLCHVAPHDIAWREERVVKGRRTREQIDVPVRGALWLADLRFRSWVPILGEDGKTIKTVANADTLKHLLDPGWLEGNAAAVQLLSKWFGFDELELLLLGNAPDPEARQQLRNELARLVELGGANVAFYTALAEKVEQEKRRAQDVERCRRLGLAVQEAIKVAIERYGLTLNLVDCGFDYEVDILEDGATRIEVGPYLLEVKATTTGDARLTPLQAKTAADNKARYILCVVDLRNLSGLDWDAEWSATKVEPLARIVTDIGAQVEDTCFWVDEARGTAVPIRNESALRYQVSSPIWQGGLSISDWVAEISKQLL